MSTDAISERAVVALWETERFDSRDMLTVDGARLKCIYGGRRRGGCGPDFADALLSLGTSCPRRGDVEIHRRTSHWNAHGHQRDPRYNGVILHVVWRHDGTDCLNEAGAHVPTLILSDLVDSYRRQSAWVEAESPLPAELQPTERPCRTVLRRRGAAYVREVLGDAWLSRLQSKARRCIQEVAGLGIEQAIYQQALEALGYSANRQPMLRLAQVAPWHRLRASISRLADADRFLQAQALLLGSAGLLPPESATLPPEDASYLRRLWDEWDRRDENWETDPPPACDFGWSRAGYRPSNSPVRRLIAAARYFSRLADHDLFATVQQALLDGDPERWLGALTRHLVDNCQADCYWRERHDFGRHLRPACASLVGQARAQIIALNVILPFMLALSHDEAGFRAACLAAGQCAPAADSNEISRAVARLIWNDGTSCILSAAAEQGLMEIYRTFCLYQACESCPLGQSS